MSRVGGAPSTRTISLEEHRVGGTEISGLKYWLPALALSLCSKSRVSWNLELLQKSSQPLPSGRVWTLNQHVVKSLKKPLKVWSYTRRTSSVKQHRANNRRASPEWRHATTRGIPSSHTASFQLKSKYQTTSKVAESCGILSLRVRIIEFSSWWSTRVKSCGNSKTVLYFNHSQLQQFIACVYVFCFMLFSLVHVF